MSWAEAKKWIDDNKQTAEVKEFLDNLEKTALKDKVLDFVKSDDGFKIVKPFIDQHNTKAIDTFKEKTLPRLVEEGIEKKIPDIEKDVKTRFKVSDPDDPTVADLKKKVEKWEKEANDAKSQAVKLEKIGKAKAKLSKFGFDDFAENLIYDDDSKMAEVLDKFEQTFESQVKTRVEAVLKTGSYKQNNGKGGSGGGKKWTRADIKSLSPEDYAKNKDSIMSALKNNEIGD